MIIFASKSHLVEMDVDCRNQQIRPKGVNFKKNVSPVYMFYSGFKHIFILKEL